MAESVGSSSSHGSTSTSSLLLMAAPVWNTATDVAFFWHRVSKGADLDNLQTSRTASLLTSSLSLSAYRDHEADVFVIVCCSQKLLAWWWRKSPLELWLHRLIVARSYEEYEDAAYHLDAILGRDLWWVISLQLGRCL